MVVLLPVLALGACALAFSSRTRCWRHACLGGALLWGTLLVGITELLSLFHALTPVGLAIAWLVVLIGAGAWIARGRVWRGLSLLRGPVDPLTIVVLVPLSIEVAVLGAIAILSPPNTWDAMSYHMARLIHWQESGSVAPYPAYVLRQLYMPPGAEFVILHLQILTGGDRLACLVQWVSMIGTLIGASLIARETGAGRAGQLCAAIFAASVPIGVLEATSTQNDQVLTFWLVCMVIFALKLIRSSTPRTRWVAAVGFGASLGLALVTKATAYVWAAPFVLWVGLSLLLRQRGLALLAASGAVALALNAGVFTRNMLVFGQPLGQTDEGLPSLRYLNDTFEPALFVANAARDLGVNVVTTPFPDLNAQGEAVVLAIHGWLGVDVTDPRTTWSGERFRAQSSDLAFNESFASNPLHLAAIVLALILLLPLHRTLPPKVLAYAAAVVGGMLLFAAVVRWQPWHSRLELPFFVLGGPLVGVVLERVSTRLTYAAAALLLVCMVPYVISNDTRSLTGARSILSTSRTDQYFTNWPTVRPQYLTAINMLGQRGCARIGFMSSADGWEYPLWALLPGVQEIEQVNVPNMSASQATSSEREFQPCAVLALGPASNAQTIQLGGQQYQTTWSAGKDLESVALMTPVQPRADRSDAQP